ncbi:MAG: OmpA family protein [Desulfobulbaceae bacterium]|nr:OmpA family protein [Desulfobulbaceae bacterium]
MKRNFVLLGLIFFLVTGCAPPQTKTGQGGLYGAAGGAAAGALLGQAIGRDTEGTLWGAAIGAALGGAAGAGVGRMMDNQERDMRSALAASEAATVKREGNLLSVVFKSDMTFDFDSAEIRPGLYPEIDRVANVVGQYPQTLIRVEGHTDSTGSEEYNLKLSQRRAQAVGNLLMQRNISSSRIQLVGLGETHPVASNETEAGRLKNRRVEIKIVPSPS